MVVKAKALVITNKKTVDGFADSKKQPIFKTTIKKYKNGKRVFQKG